MPEENQEDKSVADKSAPNVEDLDRVLLVGLGNPGSQYADTRHNVGFMVAEELARIYGIALTSKRFDSRFGDGMIEGKKAAILLPQTYMNRSGSSVANAQRYMSLERGAVIVIHDDVDLPLGKIRLKWAGGNGGHKGLRSIDASIGGPIYFRVRVGVGRPAMGSVTNHVLARFSAASRTQVSEALDGAVESVRTLLKEGLTAAQNQIHGRFFGSANDAEATGEI